MRAVVQRVSQAQVSVEGEVTGKIGRGFLVYLGVGRTAEPDDMDWLSKKIIGLKIFEDAQGNRVSLQDVQGEILLISQFTLFADVKKGTRPSYHRAGDPDMAKQRYEAFGKLLEEQLNRPTQYGVFGAHMHVESTNDGPVTLILDSQNRRF